MVRVRGPAQYMTLAGQDELRYTEFTPNEPVGSH
jgi:hypothetical protein